MIKGNQNQTPKIQQTTPTQKPKSNTAVIIIIIVVVILALGVGGYFGWKYLGKKLADRLSGKTTQTGTTTDSSGKVSIKSVIDLLMYPGSKITDQKQGEESSVYQAELTLSSSDSVETIKNYYLDLIKKNNWKITRQGSSGDNNYYMTIVSKDFTDELDIIKYTSDDNTDIGHKISGDNLSVDGIAVSASGGTSTSTTTSGSTSSTGATTSSSYIIADSNTREISESELTSLTPWQLKVARNEIYARHGRPFVHKDLQCYFAKQSWYKSDPNFTESSLSYTENKNVATILAYEQKTNSPLLQVDSGCQQ